MKFSTAIFAVAALLAVVISVEAAPGFTKPPTSGSPCVIGTPPVGSLECIDNGDGTGTWGNRIISAMSVSVHIHQ
ncbi:hypothetical protein BDF22DRAFT_743084 [Syncephalis plumigaleata]|nr:hypothetical protein BDF22DRAFT_743084 [Syncephalis plumigaleata]